MKPVYIDDYSRNSNSIVTVGTFDGVHLGHQALIQNVVECAQEKKCRAVVVTFDPHPRDLISPSYDKVHLLTTLQEKTEILKELGIDDIVVIPFTRDFSMISHEKFLRKYIYKIIGVDTLVIGYDHQFGRDRKGSTTTVLNLSYELGFNVIVEKAREIKEKIISSTVIRRKLEKYGDVMGAREMLGRDYQLTGSVVKGDQRGRKLGFPTANIRPENPNKVLPANGVYCVEAEMKGELYKGMVNIGFRPTFMVQKKIIAEVFLFDFNKNIYGDKIKIRFLKKIRLEQKFKNKDLLIKQLNIDWKKCQEDEIDIEENADFENDITP